MSKRFTALVAVFALLAVLMIFQATRTTSSLVLLPSDLLAKHSNMARIRVGGRITNAEIFYATEPTIELRFAVEDPKDPKGSIPVIYNGLKPDMFAAGRDVIIDGDFEGGTLKAQKLLTQCPSKYEPPAVTR